MSQEYAKAIVGARGSVPGAGAIANGTVVLNGAFAWCSGPWLAIALEVYVKTAGASATQTVVLQASDTSGSFSSPTTLATVTIASTDVAGTKFQAYVAAGSTDLASTQSTRVVHVATSTDATLVYDFRVITSPLHY